MTTPETIALIGGAACVAVFLWANDRANDKDAGVQLDQADDDLRLLRICDRCRKVLSASRMVHQGQHLSVCHDICPACAKRRDAELAALTDTKVQKLKVA